MAKKKEVVKEKKSKKGLIIVIILTILLITSIAFNIYFLTKDCDDDPSLPNSYQYTEKKPVMYLYPKKNKTKVTVKFENPDLLTTTYPKFHFYKKSLNILV